MRLASYLGYQYGGDRDMYRALGYPTEISFAEYYSRYTRQDIARAIINKPVKATWPLEKQYKILDEKLKLKSVFRQLDIQTGIGRFGILVMGLNDVNTKEDWAKPVRSSGKKELLYVQIYNERSVSIHTWDKNYQSPRYGLPVEYTIEVSTPEGGTESINVHYSRVIHVVDGALSRVYGTPRLQAVWNRLLDLEKLVGGSAEDLEKLVGGSAEMFWRGARPGYHADIDKDFQMTEEVEDDLMNQIDEYEHDLRRIITAQGVAIGALQSQVSDPKSHVDVQIQMISAETGIPKRILTGSERGELASTQDQEEWLNYIQSRREDFAENCIVRPFVDYCIDKKILPSPKESYSVKWDDLFAMSEKDKTEVGKNRAAALKDYATQPAAQEVVPPEAFMELFLGLDSDQVELIQEQREAYIQEEQREMNQMEKEMETETEQENE